MHVSNQILLSRDTQKSLETKNRMDTQYTFANKIESKNENMKIFSQTKQDLSTFKYP
jgi:hypothetical protein